MGSVLEDRAWLARVVDRDGAIVGTGAAIGGARVLTCAHVVQNAGAKGARVAWARARQRRAGTKGTSRSATGAREPERQVDLTDGLPDRSAVACGRSLGWENGVADTQQDANCVQQFWGARAVGYRGFHVVGTEHDLNHLGKSADGFFADRAARVRGPQSLRTSFCAG